MNARTLRAANAERWTVDLVAKWQEANALAHAIAYDCARSDIEGHCVFTGSAESGYWYDTNRIDSDDACVARAVCQWVANAVTYLDLMGLIERDPERPHIVRIKDQPEQPTQGGAA